MSTPPPYDGNPDKRSLPAGWITQYDANYKAWFYVNTRANPPVTTWNHPSGPLRTPSPQPRYPSPANYPSGYNLDGGQGGYPCQNSSYQQPPVGGYGNSGGAEYEQNPQRNDHHKGLVGGLLGRLTGGRTGHTGGGRPPFGSGRPSYGGGGYSGGGGSYQQQQPQVVYVEQQPQRRQGVGAGSLALGAGAGLLGGVLLGEAFEDFGDRDRDGFGGNDFDGNGDFGGNGFDGNDGNGFGGFGGGGFGGDDFGGGF